MPITQTLLAPARKMSRRFRGAGNATFMKAMEHNLRQIRGAIAEATAGMEKPQVLDLGSWDGVNTLAVTPPNADIYGTERHKGSADEARQRGITVMESDLNDPLPWDDASFDVVTSNQVIEHLADTDMFLAEAIRVLRPGGTVVVSTENMSSWHNIMALTLGWQAFSLTNVSEKRWGIGNPMAIARDIDPLDRGYQHRRIFSYRGLKELLEAHGFEGVHVASAGYYPLPTRMAEFDPRHGAFITAIGKRPLGRTRH